MSIDIPMVNTDQDTSAFSAVYDLDDVSLVALVALREKHQTHHAAHSIRTRGKTHSSDNTFGSDSEQDQTLRRQIIRRFYDEMKTVQEKGLTTGDARSKRWQGAPSGNSANAEAVSKGIATKVRFATMHVTIY